ncbi:MAG: LiaF domain-containing protein [Spirochaetia bacterium]|jgi:hypothetical protein
MVSWFDGVFWGVLLILVGVWFFVRHYIPVHIPVIRVIIAVLLIYVGIRVLVRGPVVHEGRTAVFTESTILRYAPDRSQDYNVIFSSGSVDLSPVVVSGSGARAEVNVIFGSGTLHVNPTTPVRVIMTSVFGTVEAPGERSVAFGETVYKTPAYKAGAPALEIRATAVFGRLSIAP